MRLYLSSFRQGNEPEELLKLLGEGRRTAYISNALDFLSPTERKQSVVEGFERLDSVGLNPSEVDLREYFDKSEKLKKKLSEFDLIWVRGGNAFLLRRAFRQSGADKVISELLKQDKIVYGGSSAGVVILCPSLHGIELVDDPMVIPDGYDPAVIWEGLGLMPKAVVPHYKSDHPESAAIDRTVQYLEHKKIPFVTLHDGEAIVVDGNMQRIVGHK